MLDSSDSDESIDDNIDILKNMRQLQKHCNDFETAEDEVKNQSIDNDNKCKNNDEEFLNYFNKVDQIVENTIDDKLNSNENM